MVTMRLMKSIKELLRVKEEIQNMSWRSKNEQRCFFNLLLKSTWTYKFAYYSVSGLSNFNNVPFSIVSTTTCPSDINADAI